jgi:hypothetical protein
MNVRETLEYRGGTIELWYDEDPMHPRKDCDNLGTMVCLHRRYALGDVGGPRNGQLDGRDILEPGEFEAWWKAHGKGGIRLPLYLYDHSGLTISTTPFSCRWDSGQLGYIFVTAEKIKKEYGKKIINRKTRARAESLLEQEVKTYDRFLRGEFVGYTATHGDNTESVGGFDDADYAIEDAKSVIDHWLKKEKVA